MPETAENVAKDFSVARADQDEFALRSQQRAAAAQAAGFFAEEIAPVPVSRSKGEVVLIREDEQLRPQTTLEALAALKGVVRPEGTVTAGNASSVNDGAAALLIASESAAARYGSATSRPHSRSRGGGDCLGSPLGSERGAPHRQRRPATPSSAWALRFGDHVCRRRTGGRDGSRSRVDAATSGVVLGKTRALSRAVRQSRLRLRPGHPVDQRRRTEPRFAWRSHVSGWPRGEHAPRFRL